MKLIFSALTLALALTAISTAQAADKKIGNVIAVERTIDDVYNTCIDQLKDNPPVSGTNLLSCSFDAKKTSGDFTADGVRGYNVLMTYNKENCQVEASLKNGLIFVMFQATGAKATQDDSKACLKKGLDNSVNKDSFKFTAFTIE